MHTYPHNLHHTRIVIFLIHATLNPLTKISLGMLILPKKTKNGAHQTVSSAMSHAVIPLGSGNIISSSLKRRSCKDPSELQNKIRMHNYI